MLSDGFVSNGAAIARLDSAIARRSLPPAILLLGESGVGKSKLASMLAAAAVCSGADRPCGVCAGCRKAAVGSHPDVFHIDGSGDGKFNKDGFDRLKEEFYIVPNEAETKVFIIEDFAQLHPTVTNGLLKVLEDPPQSMLFVLTADNRSKVLPTVLSRCVQITLHAPQPQQAAPVIAQLCGVDGDTALQTAVLMGGNIGNSVKYLKNPEYKAQLELCGEVLAAYCEGIYRLTVRLTALRDMKREPLTDFLDLLYGQVCGAIAAASGGTAGPGVPEIFIRRVSAGRMLAICDAIDTAKQHLAANSSVEPTLTALAALMRGN